MSNIEVRNEDCIQGLSNLEDNSVKCVVTSPPYFNATRTYQRKSGLHYSRDYGEILYVIEDCFEKLYPKLKEDGVVFLNFGFSYSDGGVLRPFYLIDRLVKKLGYFCYDIIIWNKSNPIPLTKMGRLTNAIEYIFVLTKDLNYRYPIANSYIKNVWDFPVVVQSQHIKEEHGAMFPLELPRRCLAISTKKGDLVIDPFAGSGTTAVACKQMDRDCILYEINPEYCKIANKRLKQTKLSFPETKSSDEDFPSENLIEIKREFSNKNSPNQESKILDFV